MEQMISEMEVGDTVLTTSGFYGVIIDIADDDIIVEFGNNKNCRIPMQKRQQQNKRLRIGIPGIRSSFFCRMMIILKKKVGE